MSMKLDEPYFDNIFESFYKKLSFEGRILPSVSMIASRHQDPYCVLISTLISLRTKDEVTLKASENLFKKADNPNAMVLLSAAEIESLIYPAGFYKRKALQILEISKILIEQYQGKVPNDVDSLLALPGVGIKTANLTLNLGFAIDAICVDCHVHQIANRLGWINTKSPEESEKALQQVLPKRFWIPLNELLVSYGQVICTSVSPKCSMCPEAENCPKNGVSKSR